MLRNPVAAAVAIVAIVVVVVTYRFYFAQTGGSAANAFGGGPSVLAGAPAQSYPLVDLAGKTDSLDRYRGRVVLLNLWASWCAPCRSETPALERLYEAERTKGLVVLGVDQGESPRVAASFAAEMKLHYPILVDEEQLYGRAYESIGLPTSVIVDRSGRIVRGIDGELTLAQMRDAVGPALRAPE
jgi:cytochrome c biogenesis protein CcmG, thiol:disulfide interchange protein DsbE